MARDEAAAWAAVVEEATGRVAPTWPLERGIAVNPWWGWVSRGLDEVGPQLAALGGASPFPSREALRRAWLAGRVDRGLLAEVAGGDEAALAAQVAALSAPEPAVVTRARVVDVADAARPGRPSVREHVVTSLAARAVAWWDESGRALPVDRSGGLYGAWRSEVAYDPTPSVRLGLRGVRSAAAALPADPLAAVGWAADLADIGPDERLGWLLALLHDVLGVASVAAWRRFRARLDGGDDDDVVHVLAMRAAWEGLLLRSGGPALGASWAVARRAWSAADERARQALTPAARAQEALELTAHRAVAAQLVGPAPRGGMPASAQVVFCIDPRSEPVRRAVEAVDPTVETFGFAGFFGIAAEVHTPGARAPVPRLPGPLAPAVRVGITGAPPSLASRRAQRRADGGLLASIKADPLGGFTFVDAAGLLHAPLMVASALGWRGGEADDLSPAERRAARFDVVADAAGAPLSASARADLAASILRGIGLDVRCARLVVLVGHGATSTNNPHDAALQCGACGGHAGDVSAEAAARLLNDTEVRWLLWQRGLRLPPSAWFQAALHDTTTDTLRLLHPEDAPATHADALRALQATFDRAGARARAARAPRLGLPAMADDALLAALRRRAADWSEPRPEWGLTGNAWMVIGPRARSQGLDLGGRAFLHSYAPEADPDGVVLTQLLTAPMVVAHWINLQYYASVVAPRMLGGGDKALHDVVLDGLGVLEGNGGDLRQGLTLQSVHDGRRFVHEPLRLGVFVDAPRPRLEAILRREAVVRQLAEGRWVHLVQVGEDGAWRWTADGWRCLVGAATPPARAPVVSPPPA